MAKSRKTEKVILGSLIGVLSAIIILGTAVFIWYKDTHKVYTLEEITNGKINQAAYVIVGSKNHVGTEYRKTVNDIMFTNSNGDLQYVKIKPKRDNFDDVSFNEMRKTYYMYYDNDDNLLFYIYDNYQEISGFTKFAAKYMPTLGYEYSNQFNIEIDGETESYAVINYE